MTSDALKKQFYDYYGVHTEGKVADQYFQYLEDRLELDYLGIDRGFIPFYLCNLGQFTHPFSVFSFPH